MSLAIAPYKYCKMMLEPACWHSAEIVSVVDCHQVTKTVMVVMYVLSYVVEKCLGSGNVSDVLVS